MGDDTRQGLLGGVKVIDVGESVSGPYAARTLAWLGADVVKVESPEGDMSRRMGPFPDGVPHPEKSALFLALNAGKRGVTLDLESADDRARFLTLAAESQIVVDNHPSGWLDERGIGYQELSAVREDIILCQITPFGDWGPYAGYDAGDLSLFQMSANAHGVLGPVEDPNSEPAIRAGGYQAEQVAGMAAATLDADRAVRGANERARVPYRRVGVRGDGDAGNRGAVEHRVWGRLPYPRPGGGERGVHRRAGVGDRGCAAV